MKPLDEEINKTLDSLEGLKKATPPDAFKSRLMAQWEAEKQSDRWRKYLRLGVAAMVLMCLANVLVLLTSETLVETDDFSTEVIEQFMDTSDPYQADYE